VFAFRVTLSRVLIGAELFSNPAGPPHARSALGIRCPYVSTVI
jgi:hypothetical protein